MSCLYRTAILLASVAGCLLSSLLYAQEFTEEALNASIEAHRKGDFTVKFAAENGTAIPGLASYALTRHAFAFGVAIDERMFDPLYAEDAPKYFEIIKKHFNSAVHEHSLKWHYMEHARGRFNDDIPMKVWEWCRDNNILMRGHCIFWGTSIRVPHWVRSVPKNELEALMKSRIKHAMGLFKGRIAEYDVTNELLKEDWFGQKLGLTSAAPYFRWCKEQDPNAVLYVNEWGALWGPQKTKEYADLIQKLKDDGAPLGGIGIQAHFRLKIPDAETQWAALDGLSKFELPLKITELGVENSDDDDQAKDLRRFYTLYFAHPAVTGIYLWGFWDRAIYRRDAALWSKDWTPRSSGKMLTKLLTEEWATKGEGKADAEGVLKFRGFYGDYIFKMHGKSYGACLTADQKEATAVLLPDSQEEKQPEF